MQNPRNRDEEESKTGNGNGVWSGDFGAAEAL